MREREERERKREEGVVRKGRREWLGGGEGTEGEIVVTEDKTEGRGGGRGECGRRGKECEERGKQRANMTLLKKE